jgi:Lrp/AsnC family transcriptional regulator
MQNGGAPFHFRATQSATPMLDERDRRILDLIQLNADTPVSEMADQVHLSVSACSRRIARLEAEGYIRARVAVLDRRAMKLPTTVMVVIRTSRHSMDWAEGFRKVVAEIPEIVEAHRLTGEFDYLLKIVLPDVEHYDQIYKKLVSKLEFFDISAYISMEQLKSTSAIPTSYA